MFCTVTYYNILWFVATKNPAWGLVKRGATAYTDEYEICNGKLGESMRSRNYIITYSGQQFTPLTPDAAAIDIKDIAHALARIGRANGHFVDFYSVGQHCLDCANEALARGYSARQALVCLLHDASEAYLSDITSPVKKHLRQYVAVEDRLLDVIYQKYIPGGIRPKEQRVMKEIDNTMLYYEFVHFMGERLAPEEPTLVSEPCFSFTSFQSVEDQYLFLFDLLRKQMAEETVQQSWQTVGITCENGKWLAAVLQEGGCTLRDADSLQQLCDAYQNADAVLIDLPVGLPEDEDDAAHRPEQLLRQLGLGAVPCRQAVYAESDTAAREENIRVLGRTISPQRMTMRQQLREVDEFILQHSPWKNVLRQSHPQVLGDSRRMVLEQYRDVLQQQSGFKHGWEDAICLAMIGQMECRDGSATVPAVPENDAKGLQMQIVVPKLDGRASER